MTLNNGQKGFHCSTISLISSFQCVIGISVLILNKLPFASSIRCVNIDSCLVSLDSLQSKVSITSFCLSFSSVSFNFVSCNFSNSILD